MLLPFSADRTHRRKRRAFALGLLTQLCQRTMADLAPRAVTRHSAGRRLFDP